MEPDPYTYFCLQVQINKENSTRTSVYLNKDSNPARHVTVIPINNMVGGSGGGQGAEGGTSTSQPSAAKNNILQREEIQEESYYDAIFEFDTPQVWPLTHFLFLFPSCENSLICLEGKSMTPCRGNTILFRSSQQLPRLRLGPSKGFLS